MCLKENFLDFNKYDPLKVTKPPLKDWTESVPVILLSEYLKANPNAGMKLYQNEGLPCLILNPGLKADDRGSERWKIIENAVSLLMDAADDLKELIGNGKLSLPIKERVLPPGRAGHRF